MPPSARLRLGPLLLTLAAAIVGAVPATRPTGSPGWCAGPLGRDDPLPGRLEGPRRPRDPGRRVVDAEGIITWDAPVEKSGLIPQPFVEQLTAVGRALCRHP